MAYNYTPAFVAFCNGEPPEAIAAELNIPIDSLKSKMRQEGWKGLADRLLGQNGPVPVNAENAFARLEANRAKNYEMACKLRDALGRIIDQLEADTLKIRKFWQLKGQVIEYDAKPNMSDLVQLATYARMVMDMTYRALGDQVVKADAAAQAHTPPAPITVILPKEVALPREQAALLAEQRRREQANRAETSGLN
jgi:hypothetical protein